MTIPVTDQLATGLDFAGLDPVAHRGLAGLVRDHFCHGRLFATVCAHGGLTDIGYWGNQHLGARKFFHGDAESGWVKLFRVRVRIGESDYYLSLNDTRLLPFGYTSRCEIKGVEFTHELLLLADTVVIRARMVKNTTGLPIRLEMVHQEACTAVTLANRTWGEFAFDESANALIVSCRDENPIRPTVDASDDSLAQTGLKIKAHDAPDATTWIGVGCDSPISVRRGHHARSKYYLAGSPASGQDTAFFVTFASDATSLRTRLCELSSSVHGECDDMLAEYEMRLRNRPRIDIGDPVLNSAFGQYPEIIEAMKVPDRPGAVRATVSGYWVWGWDGMTPMVSCGLSNEPEYAAQTLQFFKDVLDPDYGLPMAFTTAFDLALKGPFPAQCQYIASLYHYVASTGDLSIAREMFSTCKFILDRCAADQAGDSGLVAGWALWPDFPEAMGENGNDISSLNNSFVYQGLRAMEYIAHALGHHDLAAEYRAWAVRLRASFIKYLYDDGHGYFISSCSSIDFAPRKHYCCQAIFWITPFARELVSHAPGRIAAFMDAHLRSDKCLLSLPHWDTAWMADGNQLGSSYPTADYFYVNVHKLLGDDKGLKTWLGDVDWFWRHHTAPEAFTPEAENEAELGPDNPGCKQLQAVSCWYSCLYMGVAGIDIDHEGITITPWGNMPVSIQGLRLHDTLVDITITGSGPCTESLSVNGVPASLGSRKIAWSQLNGKRASIDLVRAQEGSPHPVIARADGLRVASIETGLGRLSAIVDGDISGEVVIQTTLDAQVTVDGQPALAAYDIATNTITIPVVGGRAIEIGVRQ